MTNETNTTPTDWIARFKTKYHNLAHYNYNGTPLDEELIAVIHSLLEDNTRREYDRGYEAGYEMGKLE